MASTRLMLGAAADCGMRVELAASRRSLLPGRARPDVLALRRHRGYDETGLRSDPICPIAVTRAAAPASGSLPLRMDSSNELDAIARSLRAKRKGAPGVPEVLAIRRTVGGSASGVLAYARLVLIDFGPAAPDPIFRAARAEPSMPGCAPSARLAGLGAAVSGDLLSKFAVFGIAPAATGCADPHSQIAGLRAHRLRRRSSGPRCGSRCPREDLSLLVRGRRDADVARGVRE